MYNKRIGLDLDGVIYPFQTICYDKIAKQHNYTMGEIEFWSRTYRSNRFYGKHRKEIDKIVADPNSYMEATINEKDLLVLLELSEDQDNELFYVTARPEHLKPVTQLWMFHNDIPDSHNLYVGYKDKVQIVRELGLDIFVDDRDYITKELRAVTNAYRYFASYLTYKKIIDADTDYIFNLSQLLSLEI